MIAQNVSQRITELEEWSRDAGRPLPFPARDIVTLEDHGLVIDLETGHLMTTVADLLAETVSPIGSGLLYQF